MIAMQTIKEVIREVFCATLALFICSIPANIFSMFEGTALSYDKWTLDTVKSLIVFGFIYGFNGWLLKYIINTYKEEINDSQ